jgi:hypothetical protein
MAKKPKPAPTGLIADAVAPLRESAVQAAEEYARKKIAMVEEELEASGHDLQLCAPYPSSKLSRLAYQTALSKYKLFSYLTKWRDMPGRRMNDPIYADIDADQVEEYIANTKNMAAMQYDAYVHKLVAKIGPVESASLEQGQNLWAHSILSVTKREGREVYGERWKTQQIVNVSKLGTIFNQWPTRKMKG